MRICFAFRARRAAAEGSTSAPSASPRSGWCRPPGAPWVRRVRIGIDSLEGV